jgi:hypothetical protein
MVVTVALWECSVYGVAMVCIDISCVRVILRAPASIAFERAVDYRHFP